MNTFSTTDTTARILSAAAAAVTTLVLFSGVISISEPQRSVLVASVQQRQAVAAAHAAPTLALAATGHSAR